MTNDERDIQRKLRVLQHAEKIGNARKALGNGAARHIGMNHFLTTGASQTWAGDLIDDVMARDIFQLFHDISPQVLEAAAAILAGITGSYVLLYPLEAFRELFALARGARRFGLLGVRRCFFAKGLSGLLNLKLFKDQFQRQLCAAF